MAKKKPLPKLVLSAAGGLPKADLLERWRALPKDKTLVATPVPAGSTGSSYGEDSLRVTGSLAFIDGVLSHLTGLLRYENAQTRLDVSFTEQTEKGSTQRVRGKYVLYLKVCEKVRTTRAKAAAAAPVPVAPKRPRRTAAPVAAPVAPPAPVPASPALDDARAALARLGYKPAEVARRLDNVVAQHGAGLDCATYIKLALHAA